MSENVDAATTSASPPSGTGPSEVLLKYPELHNANTAGIVASIPIPFKPAPWWKCLFRRWTKLEYVQTIAYQRRDPGCDWERKIGVLYRQTHRRTGQKRYCVSVFGCGVMRIDTDAWEREGRTVFL